MLHKKKVNRGFTLIELLAVIVILAIILVIAVPKIMDVITDSKKASLETSAKMITSTAEKIKVQKELLGEEITGEADCSEFTKVTSDYTSCTVKFDGSTAKVNITGANKFDGLSICNADKNSATAQTEDCPSPFATDSWSEIIAAYESGDFPYKVGDTKEIALTGYTNKETDSNGLYTVRIANTTPCSSVSVESQTACGLVIEFEDIIKKHNMNPSGEYNETTYSSGWNKDGFPASRMYKFLNTDTDSIYNSLPTELKNAIIGTTVISSHGSEDTDNFTTNDVKLYLLSGEEIYSDWSTNGGSYDTSIGTSRQLDYYSNLGVSTTNYSRTIKKLNGTENWWWLRVAHSSRSNYFYIVTNRGTWNTSAAYTSYGASPAFRLAV